MSYPVVILALRPTARALAFRFVGIGALAATGSVLILRRTPGAALLMGAVFLAAGAAPVLDDRAAATTESSATPLWVRRAVRLGLTLGPLGGVWLMLLALAALLAPSGATVPLALATWHWVGMVAVVLTFACLATSLTTPTFDGSAGVAGLFGTLLADVLVQRLWPKIGLFLLTEPQLSDRVQARMVGAMIVATATLVVSSRDPARPRMR